MAILEALGIFASPIIGMVGGIFTRKHEREQYKNETLRIQQEHEHEQRLFTHELTKMEMQGGLDAQEGEREFNLAQMTGADELLRAGIQAEADLTNVKYGQSKLGDIANFFRAMIRPSITIYLTAIVSIYAGYALITQGMTEENRFLVLSLVAMFEVTVTFWFSVRFGGTKTSYNDGTYSRV